MSAWVLLVERRNAGKLVKVQLSKTNMAESLPRRCCGSGWMDG